MKELYKKRLKTSSKFCQEWKIKTLSKYLDVLILVSTSSIGKGIPLVRMNTQFGVPVINILWTIVAGRRFQSEDPQVQRMMTLLNT